MKFFFGKASKVEHNTLHPDLQLIFDSALALDIMDFSIIEGYRSKQLQNRYFEIGRSKVQWPDGKHNKMPSTAGDAAPYINRKVSWNKLHCCVLAGIILSCAARWGIKLRWGGNWDMDSEPITDQDFQDLVHYELA